MKGTKAFAALLALLLAGTPAFAATTAPQGDVFSRVTARSFTGKALPLATLRTLTAAAFSAPTAVDQRSLEFFWVTDRGVLGRLKTASPYATALDTAPAVLVICANMRDTRIADLVAFDAGAAAEAVLAEAAHLGLHSVPMSLAPVKGRIEGSQKALGLTTDIVPQIMVAVGEKTPDAVSGASAKRYDPKRVHLNTWEKGL